MTGIGNNSILVTSQWDDENIRKKCLKQGAKLLPKELVEIIPVNIS
jgi:hypothetical protein